MATPMPSLSRSRGAHPIREALFRELERDLEAVRDRKATMATCLVGSPDVGKGWVLDKELKLAEDGGYDTLRCRSQRDESATPLALFRGAIASWKQSVREESGHEEGAGSDPRAVAPTFELGNLVLQAALPSAGTAEERSEEEATRSSAEYDRIVHLLADPSQTAQDKRARLLTQIRTFLVDRAREAPLVLALEDLQFADHVSADLVAVLLEWRPKAPLWILMTYTAEEDLYPPLRRALERTFLSQVAIRRPLAPLSAGEMRLFLLEESALRSPLPAGVLDEVIRRAQGLPGAALRLARAYQAQGVLPGASPNASEASQDPWAQLTEDQERTLAISAVAGPSSSFELLRRAAGEEEERMAELLEELVQRGLLEEGAGGTYSFVDDDTRQQVYQGLTRARRRVLHRKVAQALEGLPGTADPARVFLLAHHCAQGGVDEKALAYLEQALRLARAAGSLPRQQSLLRQSLEIHQRAHPEDRRGEAALLHQLGSVAYALGSDEEAAASLSRARDLLQNLHDTSRVYAGVLLDLARVTARRGDIAVAQKLADEALKDFRTASDALGAAMVHRFRSRLEYASGEYQASAEDLRECLRELRGAHGPPGEIGRTLTALADCEFQLDHASRPDATKKLEEGIRMLITEGDRAGALFAEVGRAAIEASLGDQPAVRATMERVQALLNEVPEVWRLQEAMLRKAGNHTAKGELAEALGLGQLASDLAHRLEDREREGRALIFTVDAAGRMGRFEQAEQVAEEALRLGRSAPHPRTEAEALVRLAMAAHMKGDDALTKQRLEAAAKAAQGQELSRMAQAIRRDLVEALDEAKR